ncbi:MAG TPA: nitroreductase family protein [Bacteroidales bacterium]|nr:nitroreductase family protein [Bacteroidales bacterium]
MDFLQLVNLRESTRKYADNAVEQEKIEVILEACRLAPSACNSQPWKFVVVNDREIGLEMAKATFSTLVQFNRFVLHAPVIVALVSEPASVISKFGSAVSDRNLALIDLGIVAEHFCLQAAELGLGTCMIGWFDEKKVRGLLGVPKNKRIHLLITLGYPASDKKRKKIRKSVSQISSYNRY